MTIMTVSSLHHRLHELIKEKRRSGLELYYISQVGSDLGISSRRIEALTGRKLVDFIKSDLGYKVASPAGTANTAPFIYFSEKAPTPTKRVRFAKPFWDAFATASSEPRFLRVTDLKFGPAADLARSIDGVFEIEPEFQPSSEGDRASDLTSVRIERWLRRKGLSAETFSEDRLDEPRTVRSSETTRRESVLERLFQALSDEERTSLSLPITVTRILASLPIPTSGG